MDQMFRATAEAGGEGLDPITLVKAPSNLLLTNPRWYFCCGFSVMHVFMSYVRIYVYTVLSIWSPEYASCYYLFL